MSALFRGAVNIWLHYIRFRTDSDIGLLSFIIQSALQSRILFVTRLANKQHCINHPHLDFNAFHIPVDVKHSRYIQPTGIPTHKQTQRGHRGAQACLDSGRSCWRPHLHRNWTSFVLCSQPDPSAPLLPRSYSPHLSVCRILKREHACLYWAPLQGLQGISDKAFQLAATSGKSTSVFLDTVSYCQSPFTL